LGTTFTKILNSTNNIRYNMEKEEIKKYNEKINEVRNEIKKGLVGQEEVVDLVIKCLICNSHALLEGVPGLGKTLLVRVISSATGGKFERVQFTPDLLPSDITGSEIYREEKGTFEIQKGPVFTNFLLADEINRSPPPKVQSALLQAMEEREITIGRETLKLPSPFFVLATQNPLEQQGTFPLSIAQKDRFLFKIYVKYPSEKDEFEIIERNIETVRLEKLDIRRVIDAKEFFEIYEAVKKIEILEEIKEYIMDIIEATRNPEKYGLEEVKEYIKYGVSPRASIFVPLASKATALIKGRSYVTVDDVKDVVPYVLAHRLVLSYKGEAEGVKPVEIIEKIINEIPIS
jgi:MoxR-like ATPase